MSKEDRVEKTRIKTAISRSRNDKEASRVQWQGQIGGRGRLYGRYY